MENPLNFDHQELLYKVLVIGDIGTGKTSIIKRYVHNIYSTNYKSTIGVDFALKVIHWDNDTTVRLQLCDIAGQERFGNMTRAYYKEAVGAFLVFDVTRRSTFDAVTKWKQDLDSKVTLLETGGPIPVVLIANKIDLLSPTNDEDDDEWNSLVESMDKFCETHGFIGWFQTSAKDNLNIETAANTLVASIIAKVGYHQPETIDKKVIVIDNKKQPNQNCCY